MPLVWLWPQNYWCLWNHKWTVWHYNVLVSMWWFVGAFVTASLGLLCILDSQSPPSIFLRGLTLRCVHPYQPRSSVQKPHLASMLRISQFSSSFVWYRRPKLLARSKMAVLLLVQHLRNLAEAYLWLVADPFAICFMSTLVNTSGHLSRRWRLWIEPYESKHNSFDRLVVKNISFSRLDAASLWGLVCSVASDFWS